MRGRGGMRRPEKSVGTAGFIRDVIRRWRCEAVGSLLSSDGVYSHTVEQRGLWVRTTV